ncbi:MAG: hypothetical protein KatS3mg104_0718 [Phycisphaerae bacterium]|nr:MAG: hypothetical protein KatS3mg104_0718 [Phycisphaerae bacterium]
MAWKDRIFFQTFCYFHYFRNFANLMLFRDLIFKIT